MVRFRLFSIFAFFATLTFATTSAHADLITSDLFRAWIVKVEGMSIVPYYENGQWDVGVGHKIEGERKAFYSEDELYAFLDADFANAVRICRIGVTDFDDLPYTAQLVTISLAFNCGPTGFMKWRDYRRQLSRRHYHRAAEALKSSRWWNQVSKVRAQDAYAKLNDLDN